MSKSNSTSAVSYLPLADDVDRVRQARFDLARRLCGVPRSAFRSSVRSATADFRARLRQLDPDAPLARIRPETP